MTMKQYKILNQKLNSIIQSHADLGGGSSISSLEIDSMFKLCESRIITKVSGMLKAYESMLMEKIDFTDQTNELRIKNQRSDFMGELKDLRTVTKERHVLFVQEVKKVREDVNSKIQELREDMNKEILSVQPDYMYLTQKVDIICDAVTGFVKLYEGLSPQLTQISKSESENFDGVIKLLNELKEISTKPVSSPLITLEFLSQKLVQFEAILNKQLAPLFLISSLLPTTITPPVFTGVQGGERKSTEEDAKVVGKVFPSNFLSSKTVFVSAQPVTSTIVNTLPITRTISKGIVIGKPLESGGSSSKPKDVTEKSASKDKCKSVLVEKSKEEKKAEAEAELEKMRLIQSIMTQRAGDPKGMDKTTMKQSKPQLPLITCTHLKRSQNRVMWLQIPMHASWISL